jgi:hypothetical protein
MKMLFYIGSSVARNALLGDVESTDLLTRIVDSRMRGLMLLYASPKTSKLVYEFFLKIGNVRMADIFLSISKKFREKKQIIPDLTRFVVLSCNAKKLILRRQRIIYLSPRLANRTNILYPAILLGEALTDCNLYVNTVASNFVAGLPVSMHRIKLSDRFEPGGGGNTHASYSRHKEIGVDLCLCIVDSDRRCPEERAGDTAKFVMDVDRRVTSALCTHLLIDAYSAENLLPMDEIERQYNIGKNQDQVEKFKVVRQLRATEGWRFLPLKRGIKGTDVKSQSASARYWSLQLERIGIVSPCCDVEACACHIVPSISDKTLAVALETRSSGWPAKLADEMNLDIRASYLQISREVRSWLCVGAPIRA